MRPRFDSGLLWGGRCCRVAWSRSMGGHMLKRKIRSAAVALLVLSSGSMAGTQGLPSTFTIDIPGATFTRVLGLNAQGDVCGGTLLNGARLAFAGSKQADFTDLTTFAYPGSVFTQGRGINAAGQMVGADLGADRHLPCVHQGIALG